MSSAPTCRSCGANLRLTLIDLGPMPLANAFLSSADEIAAERTYPLHARVCEQCFLVQVDDVVPPEEIFTDYAYFSSYSESWIAHAKAYAMRVTDRLNLTKDSLVVEIASNDGYLLRHFKEAGIPVLGIEPAANVAAAATAQDIPTEVLFFGKATATSLAKKHRQANLIVANNVLAHVPDINDFVAGMPQLLAPDGVVTLEFPHLQNLIEQVQFDTIYHEHFSYLSLFATERLFARHKLRVFDVEQLSTHGGSLRLWVCHADAKHAPSTALAETRAQEETAGLTDVRTYAAFGAAANNVRLGLRQFLDEAREDRKRVVAYGAAAKGNTLLNSCHASTEDIEFVADLNEFKQGRLLPGSHIPVRAPQAIYNARPDYVLILPWNLTDEITESLADIREWGAQFVVAVPRTTILP